MRTARICDTCAEYFNALCVLYNGDYLQEIGVDPLDSLEEALQKIAEALNSLSGSGVPTDIIPAFLGQQYRDTDTENIWIGLSQTIPNWGLLGTLSTTTTTTVA